MRIPIAIVPALGLVVAGLSLSSCGGKSATNATPVPSVSVVAQGSDTIDAPGCTAVIVGNRLVITCNSSRSQELPTFSTTVAGRIEFILDWTLASNDLDAVLRQGTTEVGRTTGASTKPERLQLDNMPAGTYTPVVVSRGPQRESFSYQILVTH